MGANAKGTVFLATIRFIKESFGEEGLRKVLGRLNPEEHQRMETPILSSAWYPLSLLLSIMRAAKAEFGASMPDLYNQMGRSSADYSLSKVYSLVFKLSSPQWIVSRASVAFASYYNTGKMSAIENGKGFATVELSDFAEPAPEFCERIVGWCARILEHCGTKWVEVQHIQCRCRGDKTCRFKATWT
jgi:predicted hydrocarbon binding protein